MGNELELCAFGAGTTTSRFLRHFVPDILWSHAEFFLTSFPQPLILRSQTRGIVNRLLRCPQHWSRGKQDRVQSNIQRGRPHFAPRLGLQARLSWAFAFFLFWRSGENGFAALF